MRTQRTAPFEFCAVFLNILNNYYILFNLLSLFNFCHFTRYGTVTQWAIAMPCYLHGRCTVMACGANPNVAGGMHDGFAGGDAARKASTTLHAGGQAKEGIRLDKLAENR